MRIAHTILLAVATAVAAMAFSATTASAQAVELTNEATAEHCELGVQNCELTVHSESETSLRGHQFGFESTVSQCLTEYTGYFGEDGSGHFVDQLLADGPGQNCTREPCGDAVHNGGESEWPAQLREAQGRLIMELEFCIEPSDHSDPVHCELDLDVNLDGHHSAELRAEDTGQSDDHQRCHHIEGTSSNVEIRSHSLSEPAESDEIEVVHLQ